MKIRAVKATNFLSWDNLVVSDIKDQEFWVGPNGGGKSNLFTVISHVVDAANALHNREQYSMLPDRQDLAHHNNRNVPIDAAIYVEWASAAERDLLRTVLGALAADPDEVLRSLNLGESQYSLERLNVYASHLAASCDATAWGQGWLGVRWFPDPMEDFLVYYAPCSTPEDQPAKPERSGYSSPSIWDTMWATDAAGPSGYATL